MNIMKKRVDESQINRKLTAITEGQHSQLDDLIQIPNREWYYTQSKATRYSTMTKEFGKHIHVKTMRSNSIIHTTRSKSLQMMLSLSALHDTLNTSV